MALDDAMNTGAEQSRNNPLVREVLRETNTAGVINIPNWLTSPYVRRNPQSENYATSLRILLPEYETVTPTILENINFVGLDNDGKPITVYDTQSLDDATLVDEGESLEIEEGDVIVWAELPEEDDTTTPLTNEKSNWQKVGTYVADAAGTLYNTGQKALAWIWKNGGAEAAKIGVAMGIDYMTGGRTSFTPVTISNVLAGTAAPLLSRPDNNLLIPYNENNENNNRKIKITPKLGENNYEIDFTRLFYVSSTLLKLPNNTEYYNRLRNIKNNKMIVN